MIFRQELIDKILAGEKTVTRRPVKFNKSGKILPCKYKVGGGPGGTYALQGPPEKGSRARARTIPGYRLRITGIRQPSLAWDLTDADARREGFVDRHAFRAYWLKLYGRKGPALLCWRIRFELVEGER